MLMSVEEFKTYVDTDMADVALEARLRALELLIRAHTHNNFQKRGYQARASITGAALEASAPLPFNDPDHGKPVERGIVHGEQCVRCDLCRKGRTDGRTGSSLHSGRVSDGCKNGSGQYAEMGFGEPR